MKIRPASLPRRKTGFSLIELMVAMILGLLVSAGIVALFTTTSRTNLVQNGLARMQENGRYVISRIASDLRMTSAQYCSNTSVGDAVSTPNGVQAPLRAPMLHIRNFTFPDWSGGNLSGGASVALSPRYFMQGYDCDGSGCRPATPSVPTTIPVPGTADGNRVRGSDVLTVRYLRNPGWFVSRCDFASKAMTVAPDALSTPLSVRNGDAVLVSDCSNANVFTAQVAGNVITPSSLATGAEIRCPASASINDPRVVDGDPRLFNFTKDFVSVTYYLKVRTDGDPDHPGRVVPVLMRRESDGEGGMREQEIAEGVERLDFLYGVEDAAGRIAFLNAGEVQGFTNCPAAPSGVAVEAGCGWRSVKSIEVHLLLNTVGDVGVAEVDTSYRYGIDGPEIRTPPATLPSGLPAGRMMRREFVAQVTARNFR
ncbi:PilW family protein [Tahibacter soli]|uniref:PilW family protein n=1 Tax=Tahibacter soli TaxID=2983605 RepID=A0A9X3YNP6_9GAMM|nr:PilW family protein [Tahibacter soli]MDC8015652.1 PilW family protein [Tahibacter soli]